MQSLVDSAQFKTREQAAYEQLRRSIIDGRLGPGMPLIVSRLALDLGVSRITVANALKRLAGEGFVRLTPHKEATVTPIEAKDIREIYLMRAELEALSAREAATRITPRDLAELHALNNEIGAQAARDQADIRAIRAADLAFHRRLRDIPDMPHLAQILQVLADQCEGYRARTLDERMLVVPSPARHARMLDALAQQDPVAAAEALREHLLGGMDAVLAVIAKEETAREIA